MSVSVIACILVLLGVMLPFWGFVVIGIAIALVRGSAALALLFAGCADILYGPPVGILHLTIMPFVWSTLLALGIRYLVTRDMREGVPLTL